MSDRSREVLMSPSRIPRILTGSLLLAALALAPAAAWAFTATLTIPNLCAAPIDVTLFSLEANNTVVISGGGGGAGAGKASLKPHEEHARAVHDPAHGRARHQSQA